MLRNIIAGVVLAMVAGATASAETVTYSFEGTVNAAFYKPTPSSSYITWYAPNTTASGDITVSLPAVDSDSSPNTGSYLASPNISGDLTVGTDTISLTGSTNSVDILNDGFGEDHVILNFDGMQLFLQDSSGTALSSDAIPTSVSFSQFDTTSFSFSTDDFSHYIVGSVTALSVSVDNSSPAAAPLPGAAWGGMVLIGCLAIERIRRKIATSRVLEI